ncbi:oxygenase MpaB family protein [Patulibacter defluvii]|uniref:oxygenase MpaB family protein n=1 Tax=Patulibacter defluvii TaxID=3095358 RepID=UPI002A748ECA|nr:oxygenase MpaB family protein [Patulibacter sp. DM4]
MPLPFRRREPIVPHEDHGFFGPDSVTWRVWSYPTSLTVGFQRAVVIEELDPALIAAVDQTDAVRYRPRTRYDRTLRYFALVAFGSTRATSKAADVLVKVHSKAVGIEPLSGNGYDANDPHSQLWIHLTAWHSILYAYERYGPGKLSAEDEARYWQECAVAAELQTCDPADVPRTREGIRAYFAEMRPRLAGSEAAQSMMDHLLNAEVMLPPLPRVLAPARWVVNRVLRAATIATMPRWMRKLGGLRQPRAVDVLVRPLMRVSFAVAHLSRRLELVLLGYLSPATVPVVAPILLGIPPQRPETLTPAEARERYGYDRPAEAHLAWRAKQRERVLEQGQAPSDAGLVESEAILGSMAAAGAPPAGD